jgi:hypothetical protein
MTNIEVYMSIRRSLLTKILANKKFTIHSDLINKEHGIIFSAILSKILGLIQTHDTMEVYYTAEQCKSDMQISYYHYKKVLKKGEEIGLWLTVAKYNKQARGTINNLLHIKINFKKLELFFKKLGLIIDKNFNNEERAKKKKTYYKNSKEFKQNILKNYPDGADLIKTDMLNGVADGTVYIKDGELKADFMNFERLPNTIAIKVWEFAFNNQNLLISVKI